MLFVFGEYRPDVSDFRAQSTRTLANVLPRADGYGPFADLTNLSGALAAACRGLFFARKADGTIVIFAGTSTRLYKLDNTTYGWTDVSKALASYAAIEAAGQWQFAQFNNFVVAVQANVPPQVFDLSSSTEFADLAGSPPQARYVSIVNRFVVLSGLLSNPFRIQWSGLNAATTWTAGTSQSDYQDLPDGGIVRGVGGGESGIIFQDGAIRRMTYAPGSPVNRAGDARHRALRAAVAGDLERQDVVPVVAGILHDGGGRGAGPDRQGAGRPHISRRFRRQQPAIDDRGRRSEVVAGVLGL